MFSKNQKNERKYRIMNESRQEAQKKKNHYTVGDLNTELDALRKKVKESSTKEEIRNYLEARLAELENR